MPEAAPLETAPDAVTADDPGASQTTSRFFFGLGLALQCLLWFLVFFAIVVAVATGGHLTEFRYVGF